jgi:hypothetical protein
VFGAWQLGTHIFAKPVRPARAGYLTLITLTGPGKAPPSSALLVIKDRVDGRYSVYTIPRELLLEGPGGAFVFAGDAMARGALRQDLERVIHARIDAAYGIPVESLGTLAGSGDLAVTTERPVTLDVGGLRRAYRTSFTVPAAQVAALYAAPGPSGDDEDAMQRGLLGSVLAAAALRPPAELAALRERLAARYGGADRWHLADAVRGISMGKASIARLPSRGRVSEGQFAFVPDPEGVMAAITRRSPGFHSGVTVVVRNGTGKLGAAEAVMQRLATLDVNLPSPGNADSFTYRQTQILAGGNTLPVAEEVRAILGAGVVLDGHDVPAGTIIVIVGRDLSAKAHRPKDRQ